jgi:hypothetical protein
MFVTHDCQHSEHNSLQLTAPGYPNDNITFNARHHTVLSYLLRTSPAEGQSARDRDVAWALVSSPAGWRPVRGRARPVFTFTPQKHYIKLIMNPSESVQWLCAHNNMRTYFSSIAVSPLIF